MGILNIAAPIGGIARQTGFQKQPPFTTIRSINMWPKDVISGRQVSASRPPLSPFQSPGGTVNCLTNVNGDATQTPQFSMVAAANGRLYRWDGTGWAAVVSSSTVTTGRPVSAHAFLKRVVIMNDMTPLVFNYADNTLVPYVATVGTIPSNNRIVTAAFGAVWIAGSLEQPHVFSCSRTGNIFDWDFSVANTDLGGAYTSTGEDEGFILEPITALIPLNSDTLIIACVDEMWALRAHPRRGGILEKLPDKIGVLGFTAWTKGPDGEVYFLSRLGIGVLDAAGTRPTLLSKRVIPAELVGLPYNYTNPTACVQYNPLWNGVHISIRGAAAQSWWMDLNEKISFHEEILHEYPMVTTWFGSLETEAAAGVLYGGASGLSRFDSLGSEDMACELVTGPFRISESDTQTSRVMQIDYRFLNGTTDAATTTAALLTGANGDDVVQRYENELLNFRETATMAKLLRNGGRTRPLLSGAAGLMVMQSFGGDRMVFEGAEIMLEPHGKNIFIPRQTEFEEPSTNVVIGNGWVLGGVYATATGATPSANLNKFSLFVNLSNMPLAWWAAVKPDGSDIRATTGANALLPIDLVEFDKGAKTGFLIVRHDVVNGVAPVLRVWCGNPLAVTAPAGGAFGRHNAYPSDCLGFWPSGGGRDRTRNRYDFVGLGGVDFGGATGVGGFAPATDYDFGHLNHVSFGYVFSSTTADADPGNGFVRLDNVTQLSATTLRIDLLDANNFTRTTEIAAATNSNIFIRHATDPSKWIRATVSAVSAQVGYYNLSISGVTGSGANPFTNNDAVRVTWRTSSNLDTRQENALLEVSESISACTMISYDNPVTAWAFAGTANFEDRLLGLSFLNDANTAGVITMWEVDLVDKEVKVVLDGVTGVEYTLSINLSAAGSFHQVATTIAAGGALELYVDGVSRDIGTHAAFASSFDVARLRMVGSSSGVLNIGHLRPSLTQFYNTNKSSTFIAYQNSMIAQATFWSGGWTMG